MAKAAVPIHNVVVAAAHQVDFSSLSYSLGGLSRSLLVVPGCGAPHVVGPANVPSELGPGPCESALKYNTSTACAYFEHTVVRLFVISMKVVAVSLLSLSKMNLCLLSWKVESISVKIPSPK